MQNRNNRNKKEQIRDRLYSEKKRQKNNVRLNARKKILNLLERQKDRCYICTKQIKSVVQFSSEHILWKNSIKFCVLINGKKKIYLRATVDHIKAIEIGGTNHLSNLAAACYSCNQRKSLKDAIDAAKQKQVKMYKKKYDVRTNKLRPNKK